MMKGVDIIGIGGFIGSGKDAVADILVEDFGFHKLAFAKSLKEMCMLIFSLNYDDLYTQEGKFRKFSTPIVFDKNHVDGILRYSYINCNFVPEANHTLKLMTLLGKELESPRKVLQFIGTEACRYCIDPDYHAINTFDEINKLVNIGVKKFVLPDMRFENERDYVSVHEGKKVYIMCKQTIMNDDCHDSETSLGKPSEYDFVVNNDKDKGLEFLKENMNESLLAKIGEDFK